MKQGSSLDSLDGHGRGRGPNLDISAIRLERAGLIERKVQVDDDGYEYFAYSVTESGIEELLRLDESRGDEPVKSSPRSKEFPDFADDDIPF